MRPKHYIDAHMKLHAGALHVWAADLDAVDPRIEELLDERERDRAARIVREPVRVRWMAARATLRVLLGDYLEEEPRALRFTQGAHGKPGLELPVARRLHFNLSHSGGLALYALTDTCEVGVDIELPTRHPNAHAHRRDFLREWVRREAEAKRLGVGVRNTAVSGPPVDSQSWIAELELGFGAVGAVALAAAPIDFQVYGIDRRAYGSILSVGTGVTHRCELSVSKSWRLQEIQQSCGNDR